VRRNSEQNFNQIIEYWILKLPSRIIQPDEESDAEASENAEPYAQLIYRALRAAAGYGIVLKDN
jgi:hypothetical protein